MGNLYINLFSLVINFLMLIYNLFAPLDLITNMYALEALVSARLPNLLTYLGYLSFFIPLSYFAVPVIIVSIIISYRLIFAFVHLITTLLQAIKII